MYRSSVSMLRTNTQFRGRHHSLSIMGFLATGGGCRGVGAGRTSGMAVEGTPFGFGFGIGFGFGFGE